MAYDFKLIRMEKKGRIGIATIDAPPVHVMTLELYGELAQLSKDVEADDDLSVFILRSAHPDFFIAHFDVGAILQFPTDTPARRSTSSNEFHDMCERFRLMPKVTIAQIEGRVGGGGSELSSGFDLRYGVYGKTKINQMEVPLGILPGGTGTQRLPRLIGRDRALELIMSGDDMDAETAEKWGYLTRAFEAGEIGPYVDRMAARIASFPIEAVQAAKRAINASDLPLKEGLFEESYQFQLLLRTDGAKRNMQRFLDQGGQTHEGESRIGALNGEFPL